MLNFKFFSLDIRLLSLMVWPMYGEPVRRGDSCDRQRPCFVSSPLNSSSGRVESGRVAFRHLQRSRF